MDSFPNLLDMTTQTHSGELFWGFIILGPRRWGGSTYHS